MTRRRPGAVRARLRRAVRALRGTDPVPALRAQVADLKRAAESVEATRAEVRRLAARVAELEADLDEQRSVSGRVADLSDAVAHLLAVAARGDAPDLERAVREYARGL